MEARSSPFQSFKFSPEVIGSVSTIEWWNSILGLDAQIKMTIFKLLSAVASSSGVERIFSSYGLVQSKLRNKLGTAKAAKLVFMYKQFNQEED